MFLSSQLPQEFRDPEALNTLLNDAIGALESSNSGDCPPPLSEEALEVLYAFAYRFYRDGLYEKARDFFRYLTLIAAEDQRHWVGLAGASQMLKDLDQALQAYSFAAILDSKDPLPHFHAAECYFKSGTPHEGMKALSLAEQLAQDHPQKEQLLTHIELLRKQWSQPSPLFGVHHG